MVTMAAQVFYEPEKMELESVNVPAPGPDQILVRVKACGICGSDVAYYYGQSSLETPTGKGPLILGHEFTGEVAEVGAIPEKLGLFQKGDRVVIDPVQYCNACEICKRGMPNLCEKKQVLGVSSNGAFAEYCVSHYTGVHKIPANVTYEQAAMTEPLACATYGVSKMSIQLGDFAVVLGAGVIGAMMLQLIKSSGAGQVAVVDTLDYRLDIAKKVGAQLLYNTADKNSPYYTPDLKKEIEKLTNGKFADACIVATGAVPAMEQALEITGRRARIVYFGLPADDAVVRLPALKSIFWDKTILFSWLAPLTWPTALQAIANGLVNVDLLRTHDVPLSELRETIALVRDRRGNPIKAVVHP
ncbi:MAG TPA: alcohol dehydrogenase catalytic domain-containing protein [bacterium]|nr:alcohol dehydrogenase catalytic domain-containing protein [Candidatus Omnitrophota bacterium]HOJ59973.1 alcohol dehydrogenase catalytic domain-containing protein [bacterium]HOL94457.1 alcohol dehydrogenase catalytic domain-containing protein [bacterium]HPO99693.1 alcohol dehydrogenase catalytic domain-containing protein [bacterium]HXK92176.1 alcohol dehydrogenase catalytic domain-containing protein [bacterium]